MFDHQFELIHISSAQCETYDFAIGVINAHEDSSPFGIKKGNNGLEKDLFQERLLDREGIILELDGHTF